MIKTEERGEHMQKDLFGNIIHVDSNIPKPKKTAVPRGLYIFWKDQNKKTSYLAGPFTNEREAINKAVFTSRAENVIDAILLKVSGGIKYNHIMFDKPLTHFIDG